jgi:DDE superfamily endonuclease
VEQNNQTTAAGASVDDATQAGLLDDLMARTAPCFARRETRLTCRDMVNGMLAELDDHNCWTMAEAAGHPGPHRMQHLLSRARVDDQRMLNTAADWAADHLCAGQDPGDVVLIVDETGDAKTSAAPARPASTAAPSAGSRCARSPSPSPARPRPGTR